MGNCCCQADKTRVLDVSDGEIKKQNASEPFCDPEFPPKVRSLYDPENKAVVDRSKMDKYRWLRAHTIFHEQEYHVFTGGIEPNDIAQGDLGDCYFLSALSALAEFPHRIKHAFETKEVTPDCKYVINFCICGENRKVVIDDYFPCREGTDKPCFSHAHGNELWVMLLEKAWAKINGSYERIVEGDACEALRAITGAPCIRYSHTRGGQKVDSELEKIWSEIEYGDNRNFIMCANAGGVGDGTKDGASDESFREVGLISSHSYSLVEAHTVSVNSKKVRLLKLRNPWGGTEWKGDWSDESSTWTPQLKQQLKWEDVDDGSFWMSYQDFVNYFNSTVVCKMDENYVRSHLNVEHAPGGYSFITCELKEDMELLFFTVSQLGSRYADADSHEPDCSKVILGRLTDQKESGNPVDFIKAVYDATEDVTLEVRNASAGKYILFVQNDCKEQHHFYLDSYAKTKLKLEKEPDRFGGKFLELILSSCARDHGRMTTYERSRQPDIKRCFCLGETKSGYGCMYYQNDSEFCTLKEEVTFTKFQGLTLMPPYAGNSYKVTVPPRSRKAIVLKRDSSTAPSQISVKATPKFEFPTEEKDVIKRVQSAAKKNIVTFNGKTYDIFWYFDAGNFLFVNETNADDCQVVFNFTIENEDPVKWHFKLNHGEQVLKEFKPKGSFKYTYSFIVTPDIESVDDVPALIREKGKKGQAGELKIYYYYLQHGNNYLWLFDNEDSKGYKLTCNFTLTNLSLDDEPEGAASWTVELPSGAHIRRKMTKVIESKPFTFKLRMSVAGL